MGYRNDWEGLLQRAESAEAEVARDEERLAELEAVTQRAERAEARVKKLLDEVDLLRKRLNLRAKYKPYYGELPRRRMRFGSFVVVFSILIAVCVLYLIIF